MTPVCICGLPGSGNRLIRRLLAAHGFDVGTAYIKHFPPQGIGERFRRAIIPVRRPDCWWASVTDQSGGWQLPTGEDMWEMNIERLVRIAQEWHPRDVLYVQYEALVSIPDQMGRLICEFSGVEFGRWPEKVFDANRPRLQEIHDGEG